MRRNQSPVVTLTHAMEHAYNRFLEDSDLPFTSIEDMVETREILKQARRDIRIEKTGERQ